MQSGARFISLLIIPFVECRGVCYYRVARARANKAAHHQRYRFPKSLITKCARPRYRSREKGGKRLARRGGGRASRPGEGEEVTSPVFCHRRGRRVRALTFRRPRDVTLRRAAPSNDLRFYYRQRYRSYTRSLLPVGRLSLFLAESRASASAQTAALGVSGGAIIGPRRSTQTQITRAGRADFAAV